MGCGQSLLRNLKPTVFYDFHFAVTTSKSNTLDSFKRPLKTHLISLTTCNVMFSNPFSPGDCPHLRFDSTVDRRINGCIKELTGTCVSSCVGGASGRDCCNAPSCSVHFCEQRPHRPESKELTIQ